MAESLGVASSIVGVVSLGIQVAQGLVTYYGSWKDQDMDISNMCTSLKSLERTLEILSKAIQPPAKFDKIIKDNVEKNIQRSEVSLKELKGQLEKANTTALPKQGIWSTMRRHTRRAFYPFKEHTLRKIQQVVSEARSNLDIALQTLQLSTTSDIHHEVKLLIRWQKDEETRNILSWLSPVNFWLKQTDVSSQRQPGTGKWLLDHSDFLEWSEGKKETIWCVGGPGVGKTILSSVIVEFLDTDLPSQVTGFAFVYCDHKQHLLQRVEYFVGAMVRQVVERKQTIPDTVKALYQTHRGKGTAPTRTEYLDLLQSLSAEFSELYVVIDALDECIDKNNNMIWKDLLTSLKNSITNLRLLYTSRHLENVGTISPESTCIKIVARDTDMRTYIHTQISTKPNLSTFCQQDVDLENTILQVVVSKSEGMFLAARLYVESLASKTNLRAVKKALNAMPTTLDDTYDQALERIKQQPTAMLAMNALTWIVYAVRPLQVQEIQHAIAIDELEDDDRHVSKDMLTPPDLIVNACAGIVKFDDESHIIGLVHKTAQEYFDRKGAEHFPDSQRHLAQGCITYLSLDVFNEGPCITDGKFELRLRENPLLEYAAGRLGSHVCGEAAQYVRDPALAFLSNKPKVLSAAQIMFWSKPKRRRNFYIQHPLRDFLGIHYVAYLGLTEIMGVLIKNSEVDLDSRDDDYGQTPLSYAAENGHEAVVKLLLATDKVDVNSNDNRHGQTPLSHAAENGHEAVVKQLLATDKADVDSRDYRGRTLLSHAAENGHEAVVKLLLATDKVDVDSRDDGYWKRTPLSHAARNGHEAVVKLLLATDKVDVDSRDYRRQTPLSYAARNGHEAVVKLLLATDKVDVDSRDYRHGQTPLSYAAENGHEAVVKLLLATDKVDVNSNDNGHGQTPLSHAAENGHEAVVKQLLATDKVDVDSRDDGYWKRTPLSHAARNGHEAVVKLLLATDKVDVDSRDSWRQTPLSHAAENGHEAVVKLLQSHSS